MTLTNLKLHVDEHNHDSLTHITRDQPWLLKTSPKIPKGDAGVSSTVYPPLAPKIIGKFNNKKPPFNLVPFVQNALICAASKSTEAVFSVIDDSKSKLDDDLDIALCVGINYGQFTSIRGSTKLVTITGMRGNLTSRLSLAGGAFSFPLI